MDSTAKISRIADLEKKLNQTREQFSKALDDLESRHYKRIQGLEAAINEERTHRLKLAAEQRAYVDGENRVTRREMRTENFERLKQFRTFVSMSWWKRWWWGLTGSCDIPEGQQLEEKDATF